MDTFTLHPSESRRRAVALLAALVAVVTSLAIAHLGSTAARANGTPPLFTITTETSPDAPGMAKVTWAMNQAIFDSFANQQWHYRLSWVTTSGGSPIGTVVLDQQSQQRTATTAVIIPNLEANTDYTITIDIVTASANSYYSVAAVAPVTSTVSVSAGPLAACASGLICGEWAAPGATNPRIRTSIYTNATSGDLFQNGNGVTWSAPSEWPTHNRRGGEGWIPATFLFDDSSGQTAPEWWNPFPSDDGTTFERSTPMLVEIGGQSVNFGTVTLSAGTPISGVLTSQVVDENGLPIIVNGVEQSRPLVPSDFKDLCVEVLRDLGDGQSVEFTSQNCAGPSGFGISSDPGHWQMSLRPGNYRIRFIDRANYFGTANVLLYNVTFSAQFWRPDGLRGERLFPDPGNQEIRASELLEVTSSARNDINGVLRPARQLRIDIVDIPFTADMAQSSNLGNLMGAVYAQDTVSGAWTGGAMTLVTSSASPPLVTSATLSANVTGLVAGRAYKIFLMAGNIPWFPGALGEQWVVGGGTLENASGIVPGPVISEPWPVRPLLVTMHRPDGSTYGNDEACLAVFRAGANAVGAPAASRCTDSSGEIELQRLPLGDYEVYAYRKSGGSVQGTPIRIATNFAVTRNLPAVLGRLLVRGLADVSRLAPGASLQGGSELGAVVLP